MTDDLVKRLNELAYVEGEPTASTLIESADRIEQLEASSEGWKEIADEYFDAIGERNTRIDKLEEQLHYATGVADTNITGRLYAEDRIEKLEAALRPFAEWADAYEPDEGDGHEVAWSHSATIGMLRAARKALKGKDG